MLYSIYTDIYTYALVKFKYRFLNKTDWGWVLDDFYTLSDLENAL